MSYLPGVLARAANLALRNPHAPPESLAHARDSYRHLLELLSDAWGGAPLADDNELPEAWATAWSGLAEAWGTYAAPRWLGPGTTDVEPRPTRRQIALQKEFSWLGPFTRADTLDAPDHAAWLEAARNGESLRVLLGKPVDEPLFPPAALASVLRRFPPAEIPAKVQKWVSQTLLGRHRGAGGHPQWGGTFRSAEDCRASLVGVITLLQSNGYPLTEEAAAAYMQEEAPTNFEERNGKLPHVDARQIRRWLDREHLNIS